ncbi:hypothetical protein DSO57_1032551 [Entomophthora muscae]|uniref:Uncharacterized protein n=1 Tax=Entomophthora muscae TaxID=34485 RepID=A0ACC2RFF9_9FUNG|nr:hypothetical protein DSO57_1032551 [Entomophthora muscae]
MSLKSKPVTNQEPTQGRGTSLQPGPMTTTLEQDNQVAKLGVLTNERTPGPSAILLPLDPSLWIFSTHKLFREKFNYLTAYNIYMEPPVTPKPMPASSPNLPTNHTGKLFVIVYITLTGVMDTIVPAAGLWSWVRKSASYLLKLAPLLWWALPAKTLAQVTPPPKKTVGQLPKTGSLTKGAFYLCQGKLGVLLMEIKHNAICFGDLNSGAFLWFSIISIMFPCS